VVLTGAMVFGIYDIRKKNGETSEILYLIDEDSRNDIFIQAIRSVRNDHDDELAALASFTLTNTELVGLIGRVESAGRSLGLDTSISSVEEIKDGNANMIRIRVESVGPW